MSADNWAVCPSCFDEAAKEHARKVSEVGAMYGKVSVDEFDAARAALSAPNSEDYRTFREDYEFYGAECGEVVASYGGRCSKCSLGLDFEEKRRFWPEKQDA